MSADIGPVNVRTYSAPEWLEFVREEDKEWMSRLVPCTYPKNDVAERHRKKRVMEYPFLPFKYQLLSFPTDSGVDHKVYIYARSLLLLGITLKEADDAFLSPALYFLLKEKIAALTDIQRETLKLFEPIFENYRMRGRFKTNGPSRSLPWMTKYNKAGLVFIVMEAMNQFSPAVILENASKRNPKITSSDAPESSSTGSSIASELEKYGFATKKNKRFVSSTGCEHYAKLTKGRLLVVGHCRETLGEGFSSVVMKVYNYSTGFFQVLKFPNHSPRSQKDILNEVRIVKHLHRDRPETVIPGIMDKHETTLTVQRTVFSSLTIKASLGTYYPHLLFEYFDPKNKEDFSHLTFLHKKEGYKELLMGLRHIHSEKILHGDIKSENIFVRSWTPLNMCIGDFGGSVFEEEVNLDLDRINGTTYTKHFFSHKDCLAMAQYCRFGDKTNWIAVHKARDVLAILLTGFEMFSGKPLSTRDGSLICTSIHLTTLLQILNPKTIGTQKECVRMFSDLLDLSRFTRDFITKRLGKVGVDHPKLIDFFVAGFQEEWNLRPSLDKLIEELALIE